MSINKKYRIHSSLVLIILMISLSACSTFKDADDMTEVSAQVENSSMPFSLENRLTPDEPVAAWWRRFDDAEMSQIIERALEKNHDIRIALTSINESRAILRRSRHEQFPSVEMELNGSREKASIETLANNVDRFSETYQAGFDTSWELDLFGRIGNHVKLTRAQLHQREASLHAVQVSVAAEVASVYINLRGNQYLLKVAEDSVKNQQKNLQMVERFAEVGRSDNFDLERSRAQYELTSARIPALKAQLHTSMNRLKVLTDQSIDELENQINTPRALPSVPESVAVGNAFSLLQRRPDIRVAEESLKGAIAEYNIHVADLYPRITFSGKVGYLSSDWDKLGEDQTETFRFAPSIRWAAFDLYRVQAQIDAADARSQARLAEFEKVTLLALEETDNAMVQFSREEERRLRLKSAAQSSTRAATIARSKYEVGSGDFRDVLDAERVQLNTTAELVQSETQLLLYLVGLYKSLGGGWAVL